LGPRIEKIGCLRFNARQDGLACLDARTGPEFDALQEAGHRWRDHEAMADARFSFFQNRDGERPANHFSGFDRYGLRSKSHDHEEQQCASDGERDEFSPRGRAARRGTSSRALRARRGRRCGGLAVHHSLALSTPRRSS
jgi:hypothetical protein